MNRTGIIKVISGGQTGADYAGLLAAKDLGIATGGTAPRGWRIQNFDGSEGTNPALTSFGLVEHESRDYPPRTRQNVADSDGTVWFGHVESPGGKLTRKTAKELDKPFLINPPTPEYFKEWLKIWSIKILNVAGNRVSEFNPRIQEDVYQFLIEAL